MFDFAGGVGIGCQPFGNKRLPFLIGEYRVTVLYSHGGIISEAGAGVKGLPLPRTAFTGWYGGEGMGMWQQAIDNPSRSVIIPSELNSPIPLLGGMVSLKAKLKAADPGIHHYVTALEAENLKLQRQIGKLEAENISLNNRIWVLEEENKRKGPSLEEALSKIRERRLKQNKPPKNNKK